MLILAATVPVHETSLANQHFYSTLLGRREGVCKRVRSVRLLKIMDDALERIYNLFPLHGFYIYICDWASEKGHKICQLC